MFGILRDCLFSLAALVAVLDYFGIKPKQPLQGLTMPLNRKWKLAFMLGLVAVSLGMSGYSLYLRYSENNSQKDWTVLGNNLEIVRTKNYQNEPVELDGKLIELSHFTNVTLIYRGQKPFELSNNTFSGTITVKIPNGPELDSASIYPGLLTTFCRGHLNNCDIT